VGQPDFRRDVSCSSIRRRHLLRLWLRDPAGRPIPVEQRDSRRGKGIQIDGLEMVAPLDVEVAVA
jgi:hypothetical protein